MFWYFLPPASLMDILWAGPKLNLKNILWFFPYQLHLSILKLLSYIWGINDLWYAHPLQSLCYGKASYHAAWWKSGLLCFVPRNFKQCRILVTENACGGKLNFTQIQLYLKANDNNLEGRKPYCKCYWKDLRQTRSFNTIKTSELAAAGGDQVRKKYCE